MNINFNQILEHTEKRLLSLGYSPKYCYEDQLECVINGIAFAIYGSDDGETFGFGCIFEPEADKYREGFFEELKARFKGESSPFENLLICEDGLIHLETETETYTEGLIDSVVNALLDEDGIANAVKAESYIWEEN